MAAKQHLVAWRLLVLKCSSNRGTIGNTFSLKEDPDQKKKETYLMAFLGERYFERLAHVFGFRATLRFPYARMNS